MRPPGPHGSTPAHVAERHARLLEACVHALQLVGGIGSRLGRRRRGHSRELGLALMPPPLLEQQRDLGLEAVHFKRVPLARLLDLPQQRLGCAAHEVGLPAPSHGAIAAVSTTIAKA